MTPAATGGGLDLASFHQVFFEEAAENLDRLEQLLIDLDPATADDETLNSIFRCAHSVKGGAATFGFADAADLTHHMETLLDKLRRHEASTTRAMVDALLACGDRVRELLARHKAGGAQPPVDSSELTERIAALAAEAPALAAGAVPPPSPAPAVLPAPQAVAPSGRVLDLTIGPLDAPEIADDVVGLFREVTGLGRIEASDQGVLVDGRRRFTVWTDSSDENLADVLSFHLAREQIRLEARAEPVLAPAVAHAPLEPVASLPAAETPGTFGFFEGAPGSPPPSAPPKRDVRAPATSGDATTLRVAIDKVDQLINLVGELVITQAMLSQVSARLDPLACRQLAVALADLDRNTRDLQESVMSVRMIPMSVVYSRFPRMLRDLADKLGKKINLVTQGEATELDKGLVEKITDPLTHLVRNACDHGIEPAADRLAKGKSESGTLTIAASHQGGSIVIEVRDDGRGLSRARLLAKARERGIEAPDSLSDAEVWNLIFAPGFSTAETVTDVSGRGVGMDVVKRNITALGGSVEIESVEGAGMTVKVRLPLTLAIMDAMSVAVGAECYILPLAAVVESFQVGPDSIQTIGGGARVVRVRDEYLPVVALEDLFRVPPARDGSRGAVMVLVEADGRRCALLVDRLLGQQQVVVKNLEANYRRVSDVSGATIMGDGRVALILDVASLTRRSRH